MRLFLPPKKNQVEWGKKRQTPHANAACTAADKEHAIKRCQKKREQTSAHPCEAERMCDPGLQKKKLQKNAVAIAKKFSTVERAIHFTKKNTKVDMFPHPTHGGDTEEKKLPDKFS